MGRVYGTKQDAIEAARREEGRTRSYLLRVSGGYGHAPDTAGYDAIARAYFFPGRTKLPRIIGHISSATFVDFSDRKSVAR